MKILITPHLFNFAREGPTGIRTVVEAHFQHLPAFDIELVEPNATSYDLHVNHAGLGAYAGGPLVAHIHGMYWGGEYKITEHHIAANFSIAHSMRLASAVVVPSPWVAVPIRRDMRISPHIVPHGIDLARWVPNPKGHGNYVLWNKNRVTDTCSPRLVNRLANLSPGTRFLTTFSDPNPTANILVSGILGQEDMRQVVSQATVYLSTAKETFGIGILEALACGAPVLAVDHGNARELIKHGETGYLARPNDEEDLLEGLNYCLEHRARLSVNCRESVAHYTWESVVRSLSDIYKEAIDTHNRPHDVSVVIPCFNKSSTLERAVRSALTQTLTPERVIISLNNPTDDSAEVARRLEAQYPTVVAFYDPQPQGVAHARNIGIARTKTRYVACLDADDEILPDFLQTCVTALRAEPHLGLAYTALEGVHPNGETQASSWPSVYDFSGFLERRNQVPTCCVFRRDLWERLGGYRQRYAPLGAGAEDVEFWFRMGAMGYPGSLASVDPLFRYHFGGSTSQPGYSEPDWHFFHPWTRDRQYPFACSLRPGIHQVRSYSDPKIAVCIPCLDRHVPLLWDALDSIEAQSFRDWEVAVVFDIHDNAAKVSDEIRRICVAYPFISMAIRHNSGAGSCRNLAASMTTAPYLLWLDADDRLELDCLSALWDAAQLHPKEAIYSDYTARMYLHDPGGYRTDDRLLHHDPKDGFSLIAYRAAEYDCERALRQPEEPYYQWNLVSSLTPRSAHESIGGFDESMESWEDWDYWLRIARSGVCFHRVGKRLFSYNFQTGVRREIGRNQDRKLLDYLKDKYEGDSMANKGCSGCGRKSTPTPVMIGSRARSSVMPATQMSMRAANMVRVELIEPVPTGKSISLRDEDTQELHRYGFRKQGDVFLMQRKHAEMFPRRFKILEAVPEANPQSSQKPPMQKPAASYLKDDEAFMKEARSGNLEAKEPVEEPVTETQNAEDVVNELSEKSGARRGRPPKSR